MCAGRLPFISVNVVPSFIRIMKNVQVIRVFCVCARCFVQYPNHCHRLRQVAFSSSSSLHSSLPHPLPPSGRPPPCGMTRFLLGANLNGVSNVPPRLPAVVVFSILLLATTVVAAGRVGAAVPALAHLHHAVVAGPVHAPRRSGTSLI